MDEESKDSKREIKQTRNPSKEKSSSPISKITRQVSRKKKLTLNKKSTEKLSKQLYHVVKGDISLNQSDDFQERMVSTVSRPLKDTNPKKGNKLKNKLSKKDAQKEQVKEELDNDCIVIESDPFQQKHEPNSLCEEHVKEEKTNFDSKDSIGGGQNSACSNVELAENSLKKCPSCQQSFHTDKFDGHFKLCMRSAFQYARSKPKNADTEVKKEQTPPREDGRAELSEYTFCPVCQKDLSRLNSQRRLQHVNRCLDQKEDETHAQVQSEAVVAKSSSAVLDCPLCGQKLKTQKTRSTHLKQCANKLKVPSRILLERIREQEEEYLIQLTARTEQNEKKSDVEEKKVKPKGNRKRGKIKNTNCKFDEDTQLAIALSTSMAENHKQMIPKHQEIDSEKHGVMSAFEIMMTPQANKPTKTRRKNRPNIIPKLLQMNEETRQKQHADVIEQLLSLGADSMTSQPCTPAFKKSTLSRRLTRDEFKENALQCLALDVHEDESLSVWKKTSLHKVDSLDTAQMYYVQTLMPPITVNQVKVGSKLKEISTIPGRRKSQSFVSHENGTQLHNVSAATSSDMLLASTQTAVILAELAENEPATQSTQTNYKSRQSQSQLDGFCVDTEKCEERTTNKRIEDDSPVQKLLGDLKRLVGKELLSDVNLIVGENTIVPAHKFIINLRCQLMMQTCDDEGNIVMPSSSVEAAMAFLRYLYAAETDIPVHIAHEVKNIATKYRVTELVSLCDGIICSTNTDCDNDDDEEREDATVAAAESSHLSVSEHQDKDLHQLLKEVWGDESSDDDDDSSQDEEERRMKEEEREEEEMNELYEFMSTQRQIKKSQVHEDNGDRESDMDEETDRLADGIAKQQLKYEDIIDEKDEDMNDMCESVPTEEKCHNYLNIVNNEDDVNEGSMNAQQCKSKVNCEDEDIEMSELISGQQELPEHQDIEDGDGDVKQDNNDMFTLSEDEQNGEVKQEILNDENETQDEFKTIKRLREQTDDGFYRRREEIDETDEPVISKRQENLTRFIHDSDHNPSTQKRKKTEDVKDDGDDLSQNLLQQLDETFTDHVDDAASVHSAEHNGNMSDDINSLTQTDDMTASSSHKHQEHIDISDDSLVSDTGAQSDDINEKQRDPSPQVTKSISEESSGFEQKDNTSDDERAKNKRHSTSHQISQHSSNTSEQLIDGDHNDSKSTCTYSPMKMNASYDLDLDDNNGVDGSSTSLFVPDTPFVGNCRKISQLGSMSNVPTEHYKQSTSFSVAPQSPQKGLLDYKKTEDCTENSGITSVKMSPLNRTAVSSLFSDSTSPDLFNTQRQVSSTPSTQARRFNLKGKKHSIGLSPVIYTDKSTKSDDVSSVYTAKTSENTDVLFSDQNDGQLDDSVEQIPEYSDFPDDSPLHVADSPNSLDDSAIKLSDEGVTFNKANPPESPVFGSLLSKPSTSQPQQKDPNRMSNEMNKFQDPPAWTELRREQCVDKDKNVGKKWKFRSKNAKMAVQSDEDKVQIERPSSQDVNKRKRGNTASDEEHETDAACKKRKQRASNDTNIQTDVNKSPVYSSKSVKMLPSHLNSISSPIYYTRASADVDLDNHTKSVAVTRVDTIDLTFDDEEEEKGEELETGNDVMNDSYQSESVQGGQEESADDDVWAGFDDEGFDMDVQAIPCSQRQSQTDRIHNTSQEVAAAKPSPTKSSPFKAPFKDNSYFDPPTFIEEDSTAVINDSLIEENEACNIPEKSPVFKKKIKPVKEKTKKSRIPPSPFTPMLDYASMATPDLKKHCNKVGVRAMPKKRMVKTLTHVYQETHQYETDSEFEKSLQIEHNTYNEKHKSPVKSAGGDAHINHADDNTSDADLSFSSQSSQSSTHEQLAEETSIVSSPQKPTSKDAEKRIMKYIHDNEDLHLKILHYEPIEFKEFKESLSKIGIRIGTRRLSDLLDDKCIPFTMREKAEPGQPAKSRQKKYRKTSKKKT